MSWEVLKLKQDEKAFILRGLGFVLHGEVFQGAMKGDAYWGLKALAYPVLASQLLKRWRVAAPRRFASQDNTGLARKYVEFQPLASGAPFALRFQEYVPSELLRDLKAAFGGDETSRKEPDDEIASRAALLDPPQEAGGRGPGRPIERQDRHPAGPGQDPGAKRKVARKRAKKRS